MDQIQGVDTQAMLERVSKDLKRTDYKLLHLVTSGTDHLKKLKVTTQKGLLDFKEQQENYKLGRGQLPVAPWTKLEIID